MKRASLTVNTKIAFDNGEDRHPQVIVREFCHQHGMKVLDAQFEAKGGTWSFEVQTDDPHLPIFPAHIVARPHR